MQRKTIISAALVVLILFAGALIWAFDRGVLYFSEGSVVPRFSSSAITNPVPKLDRPVTYPADFSDEAKNIYDRNIAELSAVVRQDSGNFDAWIDIAVYYRMVQDHAGAIEVWEYLRKLYPEDGVSRHNLGEYYFHYAKDYPKAEMYYRESIAVAPGMQVNFTDLYEMFRYAYKQDTTAAIDILKEGAELSKDQPQAVLYLVMLGEHYRDVVGDRGTARTYLTEARDAARAMGDTDTADQLTTEINAL